MVVSDGDCGFLQCAELCSCCFLDLQDGIQKIAEPIGIIAGIVPTTNPTSTVIFKCLLALKTRCAAVVLVGPVSVLGLDLHDDTAAAHGVAHRRRCIWLLLTLPVAASVGGLSWCLGVCLRMCPCLSTCRACTCRNAIVLSPHVRAAKCSIAAASIVREAAERAGAPPGLIQWIDKPSLVLATALMKDPKINLILATGGSVHCIAWCSSCLARKHQQDAPMHARLVLSVSPGSCDVCSARQHPASMLSTSASCTVFDL